MPKEHTHATTPAGGQIMAQSFKRNNILPIEVSTPLQFSCMNVRKRTWITETIALIRNKKKMLHIQLAAAAARYQMIHNKL